MHKHLLLNVDCNLLYMLTFSFKDIISCVTDKIFSTKHYLLRR